MLQWTNSKRKEENFQKGCKSACCCCCLLHHNDSIENNFDVFLTNFNNFIYDSLSSLRSEIASINSQDVITVDATTTSKRDVECLKKVFSLSLSKKITKLNWKISWKAPLLKLEENYWNNFFYSMKFSWKFIREHLKFFATNFP